MYKLFISKNYAKMQKSAKNCKIFKKIMVIFKFRTLKLV